MAVIYCFSSTGNSLYVSQRIAKQIDARVHSMSHREACCVEDELIGFVFPVYFMALPNLVTRFIRALQIKKPSAYIFAVATYGGMVSGTLSFIDDLLKPIGLHLHYSAGVRCVENYIPMLRTNDSESLRALMDEKTDAIVSDIIARKQCPTPRYTPINWLVSKISPGKRGDCDRAFQVSDTCTGCSLCARICPVGNIDMRSGKPAFLHHCENCVGCLHVCPTAALQTKGSKGKQRYRNPHISLQELISFTGSEQMPNNGLE